MYAIGNPFGLAGGPTVTSGVISSLNRSIKTERGMLTNLVQTDAAINPGNSGGPLVDINGNVIAINTAIIPFAQGIGFAIPIDSAKHWVNEIITYGTVTTPWLGIEGVSMTSQLASYYDLPITEGVLITKVIQDSPAEHTGLSSGDILLRLAEKPIHSVEALQNEIQKRKPGETVEIQILRENSRISLNAELKKLP
ncbi:MAG: PDZ domain-containing protein [Candidatus Korarchaeota archaeon]|nr:PDZ domain-containing protein [Candidatus Korarchaeota archaeon]